MLSLTAISGYCKHEAQYHVLEPFRSVHESLYITPYTAFNTMRYTAKTVIFINIYKNIFGFESDCFQVNIMLMWASLPLGLSIHRDILLCRNRGLKKLYPKLPQMESQENITATG